jgi:hypothetical protein
MDDILKSSTRRFKKALIFVSTISLVFWFLGLKIQKVTIGGSESTIGYPDRIPLVLIIIIVYFLGFFIFYIITDYKIWKNNISLKTFGDRINVHLSGMNDGDKAKSMEAIKGIYDDPKYMSESQKVENKIKSKFWAEIIFALAISLFALIVLYFF